MAFIAFLLLCILVGPWMIPFFVASREKHVLALSILCLGLGIPQVLLSGSLVTHYNEGALVLKVLAMLLHSALLWIWPHAVVRMQRYTVGRWVTKFINCAVACGLILIFGVPVIIIFCCCLREIWLVLFGM